MIVVRLNYRLGNQMFQYAFARCLAHKLGQDLFLDTALLTKTHDSNLDAGYRLDIFNISGKLIEPSEIMIPSRGLVVSAHETTVGFFEEALQLRVPKSSLLVLIGTWQSHKYFAEAAAIIKEEFRFKSVACEAKDIAEAIDNRSSVAVHVRRMDYISSAIGVHLGFVGLDYYRRAMDIVLSRIPNAHFFIFSDDMDWCVDNLKIEWPHTFVRRPTANRYYAAEDLYLMSRCGNCIIANSTFSWWAAWLCSNADKLVIAPRWWFADPTWDSSNLYPSTWLVV